MVPLHGCANVGHGKRFKCLDSTSRFTVYAKPEQQVFDDRNPIHNSHKNAWGIQN